MYIYQYIYTINNEKIISLDSEYVIYSKTLAPTQGGGASLTHLARKKVLIKKIFNIKGTIIVSLYKEYNIFGFIQKLIKLNFIFNANYIKNIKKYLYILAILKYKKHKTINFYANKLYKSLIINKYFGYKIYKKEYNNYFKGSKISKSFYNATINSIIKKQNKERKYLLGFILKKISNSHNLRGGKNVKDLVSVLINIE